MRTHQVICVGLGVVAALIGVALVALGVQADFVFGQAGGTTVTDACEPTARDVDFNADAEVNFRDFARLAQHWQGVDASTDVAPWPAGDGMVDLNDLSVLTRFWLQDASPPIYITWLGHASVRIAQEDMVIYVDPLDLTTSPKDATLILVTHSHSDHYSAGGYQQGLGTRYPVHRRRRRGTEAMPADRSIAPGQTIDLPKVRIIGVASYNINKTNHPKANNWVGFIVQLGSKRIYWRVTPT